MSFFDPTISEEDRVFVLAGGLQRFMPQWDEQILGPANTIHIQKDFDAASNGRIRPSPPTSLNIQYCSSCSLTWLVTSNTSASHPWHNSLSSPGTRRTLFVFADGACSGNGSTASKGGVGIYFGPWSDGDVDHGHHGPASKYNVIDRLDSSRRPTSQRAELSAAACALELVRTRVVPARRELCYRAIPNTGEARDASHFRLVVVMDSAYVVDGICSHIENWSRGRDGQVINKRGKAVTNGVEFMRIKSEVEKLSMVGVQVQWYLVSREFNTDADRLATHGVTSEAPGVQRTGVAITSSAGSAPGSTVREARTGLAIVDASGSTSRTGAVDDLEFSGLAIESDGPVWGTTTTTTSKPIVLVLALEYKDMFDGIWSELVSKLRSRAQVLEAETPPLAEQLLSTPGLKAVILADPATVAPKYKVLRTKLREFVRTGGTVIMGGLFSSFVRPLDFEKYMRETWNMSWKFGPYNRDDTKQESDALIKRSRDCTKLLERYSQKAVFLDGTKPGQAVYKANVSGAPVAFAPFGTGYLGWVGDVNGEEGSVLVTLAMCGV